MYKVIININCKPVSFFKAFGFAKKFGELATGESKITWDSSTDSDTKVLSVVLRPVNTEELMELIEESETLHEDFVKTPNDLSIEVFSITPDEDDED